MPSLTTEKGAGWCVSGRNGVGGGKVGRRTGDDAGEGVAAVFGAVAVGC